MVKDTPKYSGANKKTCIPIVTSAKTLTVFYISTLSWVEEEEEAPTVVYAATEITVNKVEAEEIITMV